MTFAAIADQIGELARLHTEQARLHLELALQLQKDPPDLARALDLSDQIADRSRQIAECTHSSSDEILALFATAGSRN